MSANFLVAKFAPDLARMEPRNIGVIVWANGKVAARFAGEDDSVPRRLGVKDARTYRSWLASWRSELVKPSLEFEPGETVSKSSAEYLSVLRNWSRGNFMLVDGGNIIDHVDREQLQPTVDQLYAYLVEDGAEQEATTESHALRSAATRQLRRAGILDRADLQRGQEQWVKVHGVVKYFKFDYQLGPTSEPNSVIQRVVLSDEKTFNSRLIQLEWFITSREVAAERCAALILGESVKTKAHRENVEILRNIANVIDVSKPREAREQLQRLAAINVVE